VYALYQFVIKDEETYNQKENIPQILTIIMFGYYFFLNLNPLFLQLIAMNNNEDVC
jgi:hypothetical protein